jgi:hypothetical protein
MQTKHQIRKTELGRLLGAFALLTLPALPFGCSPAESVYHDGNFTEEQKAAAQKEYESVDDEESQGSNKKKKAAKR